MKASVYVTLKPGVLDPQGMAIEKAIVHLGVSTVKHVRQGKFFEVDLADQTPDEAKEAVEKICRELLANPVIENHRIVLED